MRIPRKGMKESRGVSCCIKRALALQMNCSSTPIYSLTITKHFHPADCKIFIIKKVHHDTE